MKKYTNSINYYFSNFNYRFIFSLTIALLLSSHSVFAQKKPNLLIIIADQWRGQAIGFLGKEKVKTPFIDSFSKQSLVLTQMISNFPLCSPARAMLMTGNWPFKNHVYTNVNSASTPFGVQLSADAVCWSDVLKKDGYSNGYIGKWHLDSPHPPYVPTSNNKKVAWNEWTSFERRHGFDYWYAYGTYDIHDKPMYWGTKDSRDSFHYVNQWGPEHEADKAIDFFDNKDNVRNSNAPFALVVSMNPPHSEYKTVPKKYLTPYNDVPLDSLITDANIPPAQTEMGEEYRKNIKYYYANITGVDVQINRIIEGLKKDKLIDNTIVIIMADHGNCLGKHEEVSKNNIFEESLRIPFIVYWKGHIKERIDTAFLGSLPDIYPTLLDLMGEKQLIPKDIDGTSYAKYFKNGTGSIPSEQFILGAIMSNNAKKNTGFRGIRTANYTLAFQQNKDGTQEPFFYAIKNDPFELNNLYIKDDKDVIQLRKQLEDWLKKTDDTFIIQ